MKIFIVGNYIVRITRTTRGQDKSMLGISVQCQNGIGTRLYTAHTIQQWATDWACIAVYVVVSRSELQITMSRAMRMLVRVGPFILVYLQANLTPRVFDGWDNRRKNRRTTYCE